VGSVRVLTMELSVEGVCDIEIVLKRK